MVFARKSKAPAPLVWCCEIGKQISKNDWSRAAILSQENIFRLFYYLAPYKRQFSRTAIFISPPCIQFLNKWHASTISWQIATRRLRTFACRSPSASTRWLAVVVDACPQQSVSGENEKSLSRSVLDCHFDCNDFNFFATYGGLRKGDRFHLQR
jgi:hypothetical protein